jgi:hypothetical protein
MSLPPVDITLGDIARHYQLPDWIVRRLFTNKHLEEPRRRAGRWRLFSPRDVAAIERKLRELGYLPSREGGHNHGS